MYSLFILAETTFQKRIKAMTNKMHRESQNMVNVLWKDIYLNCSYVSKSSRYLGKLAMESKRMDLEKDASVKNSAKP